MCPILLSGCAKEFKPIIAGAENDFDKNNYIEAVDKINRAIPLWESTDGLEAKAQAYQLLGKSYQRLTKMDKAIESYEAAADLSTSTTTFDSVYALGVIYLAASQPASAARAFQDALRRRPDDPLSLVGLGNAYYHQRNFAEAKRTYQRLIATSPGVKDALDYLALIEKKQRERAVKPKSAKPAKNISIKKERKKRR